MPVTIPAWPHPATVAGKAFFAAARKFHALYRGAGFDALGDFIDARGAKLSWSPRPTGTPTSFGAHQRKADRCIAIRDGAAGRAGLGFDIASLALAKMNTIENEVRATLWELKSFPKGYGGPAIEAAKTAYGAAYQATVSFEKAGTVASGAAEKRAAMAETWVALAGGVWPRSRGPMPDGWEALTQGW